MEPLIIKAYETVAPARISAHEKNERVDYDRLALVTLEKSKAVTVRKNRDSSLDTKTGVSQARWEKDEDGSGSAGSNGSSTQNTAAPPKEDKVKGAGGGGSKWFSWGKRNKSPPRLASEMPEMKQTRERSQSPIVSMAFSKLRHKSPELQRVVTSPDTSPDFAQLPEDWSDDESLATTSKHLLPLSIG